MASNSVSFVVILMVLLGSVAAADNILLVNTSNVVTNNVSGSSRGAATRSGVECPVVQNVDELGSSDFIAFLTHPCRYNRFEEPKVPQIAVHHRIYIYNLQNIETKDLVLKIHALFQMRYFDPRLAFDKITPLRTAPVLDAHLRERIWVPKIFFANEKSTRILGTGQMDVLVSISPNGTVIVSERVEAVLHCWMDMRRFPFDEQKCDAVFESWIFNASRMILHWEKESPVQSQDLPLHATEYSLIDIWTNETFINANTSDSSRGALVGNYSAVMFTIHINRTIDYYLMNYFVPSIILVIISWISFWIQADQTAPRILLGTSTLLTFITLSNAQGRDLPKVSYIKMSEIWFLVCTGFFFASLLEFAVVHIIWRKKDMLTIHNLSTLQVLSTAIHIDNETRRPSYIEAANKKRRLSRALLEELKPTIPPVQKDTSDSSSETSDHVRPHIRTDIQDPPPDVPPRTPQELSRLIDCRARFIFPLSFLAFNVIYWTIGFFVDVA